MRLIVNGSDLIAEIATLFDLVEHLGHAQPAVATAVNGDFVAMARRPEVGLNDCDRVEIVSARHGG